MIRYVKGPPPARLTALAATPAMDWDGIGAADRAALREALVRDQGALCAYCQQRITIDEDPATGLARMKIEHWMARSEPDTRPFLWTHLLGVCRGVSRDPEDRVARLSRHCDTSRGNRKLFLHPVEHQGPSPREHLRYTANGMVNAATPDPRVENDIEILNLNARRLVRARSAAFDVAWQRLRRVEFATGEMRRLEQALRIVPGTNVPEHADFLRYHILKKLRSKGHAL
jgi:uncharacterized protein (TIGR02646 family)